MAGGFCAGVIMQVNNILNDYSVGESVKSRFRDACAEVLKNIDSECQPAVNGNVNVIVNGNGIGTLNEKRLHAVIKRFISPDITRHEIKIAELSEKSGASGYVADILTAEGDIYEVQTGSLFPLRGKLLWYLENTDLCVSVVYPVPYITWLCWIDPESGKIGGKRRSPKRGGLADISRELYWIREFIGKRRFGLQILFINMEEYRIQNGWDKTGKRGSERYERIPVGLEGIAYLNDAEDYKVFLPENLPAEFTASQYAKATGIRGKSTYSTLKILCGLGLAERTGEKKAKSVIYRKA